MRSPYLTTVLIALIVGACHSTDVTTPIESLASIDVKNVTVTTVPNRADTRLSLDVVFKNESNISIDPLLCSYSLQRDHGAGSQFADVEAVECQASTGTRNAIPPFSERNYTFAFSVSPTELTPSSNYRLKFQVFLEGDNRSRPLVSNLFAVPGA